jgi:membrane protease YdiL (CAAX protease family)
LTLWCIRRGKSPEVFFRYFHPALLLGMLAYIAARPGRLAGVGLRRRGAARSAALGAGLGAGLSALPLFFFHRPVLLDTPLEYGPTAEMTRAEMLRDVLVRLPVTVAFLEELAFRGLLLSALKRRYSPPASVVGSALAFAAWHYAVTAETARQTNLATARLPHSLKPYLGALTTAGGLLTTGAAGVGFGLLRERTGNLAGPVVAHWMVDALMIAALWRLHHRRRGARPG